MKLLRLKNDDRDWAGNEQPDSYELVRAKAISDLLLNAVSELSSDEEKLVVICRFYMDLSPEETANMLGIECGYAGEIESRAVAGLAERLEGSVSIDDLDAGHYCIADTGKVMDMYRRLRFRVIQGGKKD